ncbi:MAG TPA: sulfite exporter TauE/SafE family protein [Candidatus Omnitrophota bacterium]|nr:sulfite exporter TauE/SafE family protein [Candidatus Omnitrophota bacterium]HRY85871.1 sulfite exporter TauE/SafE family protein [Candidatus Omnitrophota bacterium]
MPDMTWQLIIGIMVIAFFCEYMDSTLGMGYGTTMTPVLMLFGFTPLEIVPSVLLSELLTGMLSGVMHHREGNVNFHFKILNFQRIKDSLKLPEPVNPDYHTYGIQVSAHLKVVILLLTATILGSSSAVFTARILPKQWTSLYISLMVIAMGILILACFNKQFKYSWKKIIGLGLLASFNKGLTGGGYGPLVVSGQMLSGVQGKNAIGITSLAEGVTCALGVLIYFLTAKSGIDWRLAPIIVAGAVCSVPFSVKSVKVMHPKLLKVLIAVLTIILGIVTLLKTLRSF